MNQANPLPDPTMDKKPYEPSMEEILASIRRIIADDQSLPGHGSAAQASALRAPVPPVEQPRPAPIVAPEPVPEHPEPAVAAGFGEAESWTADARLEALDERKAAAGQHGSIAAPQFPTPAGPVGDNHVPEVAAHHVGSAMSTPPAAEALAEPLFAAPAPESTAPSPQPASAVPPAADAPFAAPPEPMATVYEALEEDDAVPDDFAYELPEEDENPYAEPLAVPQRDEPPAAPGLFSAATDTSITSAFNMLAASRLADNSDELLAMVREMIRPLLRSWLDDNLPSMVERMVRAEIERVARGGK